MASSLAATLPHRGALHAAAVALRPRCTAEAPRAGTAAPACSPSVSRTVSALGAGLSVKRASSKLVFASTDLVPCPDRRGRAAARDTWRVRAQGGDGGGEDERKEGGGGEGGPNPPPQDSSGALEALKRAVPLPRTVVEALRDQVFGFDTFFVTDQEPYDAGVLFQGNLRGDPDVAFAKLQQRLKDKFGDKYVLYLLISPETKRPVAVVVPQESVTPLLPAVPDAVGATAFGLVTLFTVLLSNSPSPEFDFLPSAEYLAGPLLQGVVPSGVFLLGLLAHEAGHLLAASRRGLKLALPYFIPSWQLGSFGGITRIKSVVPNRTQLIEVAAAGPLAGALVSLAAVLLSLLLLHPDAAAGQGITLGADAFQDSLLVGGLAKLVLGDALVQGSEVTLSPVTIAAWSCLLANAINAIPAGELDGARIALGLFGRQAASQLFFVSLILLGVTGIFNDTALFWVVLVAFLQRGPIAPQENEVSEPTEQAKILGAATLVLGFLVYCPLPFAL